MTACGVGFGHQLACMGIGVASGGRMLRTVFQEYGCIFDEMRIAVDDG